MIWRTVIVTRDKNIKDGEELQKHPNVRKLWRLPWGYTLFEFHDPVFEIAYNLDPNISDSEKLSPEIQSRLAALALEQRRLLAPLYAGRPESWQGIQLGLPLRTAFYRVVDSQRILWPWFGCSGDWETESTISICGKLRRTEARAIAEVFGTWVRWGRQLEEIKEAGSVRVEDHDFAVRCEFTGPAGDACMALYTLLAVTTKQTTLSAVGFFREGEQSLHFAEIGGAGML